jgi:3-hydroxyisobutyrate dehydrogenase
MSQAQEELRRIGWIGTGVMGASMAGHLLDAGFELRVHTRMRSKAEGLLARGAEWADTPVEAAEGMDATISMVGFPNDVEEAHLGPHGTLTAAHPPQLIIDMTTSSPRLAARIAEAARRRDVESIDAPVSGGDVGARNAALSIMVGGEASAVGCAMPLFEKLGKTIVHHGPPGSGQHAKMVNQILVAASMVGTCEALVYARVAGLDAEKVLQSVGSGAAGSWTIANLAPRMLKRDFRAGFYVEHFIKDLSIALEEAGRMELDLPGLTLARWLYEQVKDDGFSRLGTHALLLSLERTSIASGTETLRQDNEGLNI